MLTTFKNLKLQIFMAFIALGGMYANSSIADDIDAAAKHLSEQNSLETFEKVKLEVQQDQVNLSDAMRETMQQVGELTKESVADRRHMIVFDNLGDKFSQDKVEGLTKLNKLIIEYQKSEIDLMASTAEYSQAKNDLDTMFETRTDVLERVQSLEKMLEQAQQVILAQSQDFKLLNQRIQQLSGSVESLSEATPSEVNSPSTTEDQITQMLGHFPTQPISSSAPLDLVLGGISSSKGRLVAKFLGRDDFLRTAGEGDFVRDGWAVSSIDKNEVVLSNGNDSMYFNP